MGVMSYSTGFSFILSTSYGWEAVFESLLVYLSVFSAIIPVFPVMVVVLIINFIKNIRNKESAYTDDSNFFKKFDLFVDSTKFSGGILLAFAVIVAVSLITLPLIE